MSKISLSPDASGTGIFTIASPNSNTNRTLTLPDDTGTIVTNSGNQAGSFTTLNTSGAVVFNDAGADVDFRVEGDTNANLLFVDASADAVGIGTSSPNVGAASTGNGILTLSGDAANRSGIVELRNGAAATASTSGLGLLRFYNNNTEVARIESRTATNANDDGYIAMLTKATGGSITERMRIDSSGNLLVGTTSNMAQGVGIQVGEVGIDGVSGFGMTSAVSIADDATITLSANTGLLVFIEYFDGSNYPAAMFFCSYAGAVQLVSSSGGSFAATDSDGNACVFKSNSTDVVTVKNRLGSTRGYSIHTLQLRGQ